MPFARASQHLANETFQMDLRSSPSQQHLHPSRSSSLDSQDMPRGGLTNNELNDHHHHNQAITTSTLESRPHKLDLYSIPVFLLELLVLAGLSYAAYYLHFQHKHEPYISGFYCDDTTYRQQFEDSKLTKQFSVADNELAVLSLLLAVPIVMIIFCELVNSMFGSLKFRQIRALCSCCKLHSITRRTIRFSGAYLLGFLIVLISCDILANTTGRLRPYFAQECPSAYQQCVKTSNNGNANRLNNLSNNNFGPFARPNNADSQLNTASLLPTGTPPAPPLANLLMTSEAPSFGADLATTIQPQLNRSRRALNDRLLPRQAVALPVNSPAIIVERLWIDLSGQNLTELCNFARADGDAWQIDRKAQSIAMSWPSAPAAIFTYACLFVSCYLCFIGTARPFRIITSVLVMCLLLTATVFDVQFVKVHYNHWDDVTSGAILALVVVAFILCVYLNRFKDTHYYENQKLYKRKIYVYENFKGYNNEGAFGQYNLDKGLDHPTAPVQTNNIQNGDTVNSMSNNDLAMRYFQIPRANYRGAPRPLSSLNQMR